MEDEIKEELSTEDTAIKKYFEDIEKGSCSTCGHSFKNNRHGLDQNDMSMDEEGKLHIASSCTYCNKCNPRGDFREYIIQYITVKDYIVMTKVEQDKAYAYFLVEQKESAKAVKEDIKPSISSMGLSKDFEVIKEEDTIMFHMEKLLTYFASELHGDAFMHENLMEDGIYICDLCLGVSPDKDDVDIKHKEYCVSSLVNKVLKGDIDFTKEIEGIDYE